MIDSITSNELKIPINYGSSFFKISRIQEYGDNSDISEVAHSHPESFQLVWITDGQCDMVVDGNSITLNRGSLVYLIPGIVHTCNLLTLKGYVLHFTSETSKYRGSITSGFSYLDNYMKRGFLSLKYAEVDMKRINNSLQGCLKEYHSEGLDQEEILSLYLNMLLTYIHTAVTKNQTNEKPVASQTILSNFKEHIERDYKTKKRVSDYADLMHITPTYLNDSVKKICGKTAGQLIRERILLEAKRLLVTSNLSVTEIAFKLSFEDTAYFWRFFKKYVLMSPKQFRNRNVDAL